MIGKTYEIVLLANISTEEVRMNRSSLRINHKNFVTNP
jgi:hypothetical protein